MAYWNKDCYQADEEEHKNITKSGYQTAIDLLYREGLVAATRLNVAVTM